MVLISNTLTCVFVAIQILHVKRNPEVPSSVSLIMLVLVSLGHMLNFESVYLGHMPQQEVIGCKHHVGLKLLK